jgi:hypothetical protein
MAELAKTQKHRETIQVLELADSVSADITASGTAAATSAAPSGATVVRLVPLTEAVYVKIGRNGEDPVTINYTTDLGAAIPVGSVAFFGIKSGQFVSALTVNNGASGKLNVTFM